MKAPTHLARVMVRLKRKEQELKGGPKKCPVFSGPFIRPTSDVDFSETVCLIYLKISQIWHRDVDPRLCNFYVNPTNRFREIDVGSWPNKWTGKNGTFFWPPFSSLEQLKSLVLFSQLGLLVLSE